MNRQVFVGSWKKLGFVGCAMLTSVVFAACGSSSSSSGTSGGSTANTADIGAAKANLTQYTKPITAWDGPTSGPKLAGGKTLVYVAQDMKNVAISAWSKQLTTVAKSVGWNVRTLDGQGTTSGMTSAMNQALALKPSGIALGAMPDAFRPYYRRAQAAGIPVVGFTAAPQYGAYPKDGIYWNVLQDSNKLGQVMADWMIVDSGGKGRYLLISDNAFQIIVNKTNGMRQEIKKNCPDCQLLADLQVPFGDAATRLPQLVPTWVTKYGSGGKFYVMQGSDFFTDYEIPSLRSAGKKQGDVVLSGMDGTPPIYQRVRADNAYQEVTMPVPIEMQAYQAVDQFNRAFHHQPPDRHSSPIIVVDKNTVDLEGGKNNEFKPSNDYARRYRQLWSTGHTS